MNNPSARIGYARVSTADQNLDVQIAALEAAGCTMVRTETGDGTTLAGRPELRTILDFIHPGETLVVTSTAAGKAFFDMLGVFAEFETNLRRKRQAEGIAAAKERGAYRGRPPRIDMDAIRHRLTTGLSPTQIARELGVSRGTVYNAKADITDPA